MPNVSRLYSRAKRYSFYSHLNSPLYNLFSQPFFLFFIFKSVKIMDCETKVRCRVLIVLLTNCPTAKHIIWQFAKGSNNDIIAHALLTKCYDDYYVKMQIFFFVQFAILLFLSIRRHVSSHVFKITSYQIIIIYFSQISKVYLVIFLGSSITVTKYWVQLSTSQFFHWQHQEEK